MGSKGIPHIMRIKLEHIRWFKSRDDKCIEIGERNIAEIVFEGKSIGYV
jgi:hypothetical protein